MTSHRLPTSSPLASAQADALRKHIESRIGAAIVLDKSEYEALAQHGFSRTEVQRAVDLLVAGGEVKLSVTLGEVRVALTHSKRVSAS